MLFLSGGGCTALLECKHMFIHLKYKSPIRQTGSRMTGVPLESVWRTARKTLNNITFQFTKDNNRGWLSCRATNIVKSLQACMQYPYLVVGQ